MMTVSHKDASEALDVIASADQKVRQYKGYRGGSPYLILWGVIWFVANAVTGLAPEYGGETWTAGTLIGSAVTVWLIVTQSMRAQQLHRFTPAERAQIGRRASLTGVTVMCFFPAMFTVLAPLSGLQTNAFISLFWAFAYMAAGAWLGTRLFLTGTATAAAVLIGYLLLREHYFLWMAVVGGGSLVLGGLWLRKL
jgi:hypothetical protein